MYVSIYLCIYISMYVCIYVYSPISLVLKGFWRILRLVNLGQLRSIFVGRSVRGIFRQQLHTCLQKWTIRCGFEGLSFACIARFARSWSQSVGIVVILWSLEVAWGRLRCFWTTLTHLRSKVDDPLRFWCRWCRVYRAIRPFLEQSVKQSSFLGCWS